MKDEDKEKKDRPKQRRPYEPPAIVTEEVFERQALTCQSKDATCHNPPFGRQAS